MVFRCEALNVLEVAALLDCAALVLKSDVAMGDTVRFCALPSWPDLGPVLGEA